jgi:hypothetical protein
MLQIMLWDLFSLKLIIMLNMLNSSFVMYVSRSLKGAGIHYGITEERAEEPAEDKLKLFAKLT